MYRHTLPTIVLLILSLVPGGGVAFGPHAVPGGGIDFSPYAGAAAFSLYAVPADTGYGPLTIPGGHGSLTIRRGYGPMTIPGGLGLNDRFGAPPAALAHINPSGG